MKRVVMPFLLTALLVLFSSYSYAFEDVFEFNASEFSIQTRSGNMSIIPKMGFYTYDFNSVGDPNIPYCIIRRVSSKAVVMSSLEYEVLDKELVVTGCDMERNRGCVISNDTTSEHFYQLEDERATLFPREQLNIYNGPALDDDAIVLSVAPFIYDSSKQELWLIRSLRVSYSEEESTVGTGRISDNTRTDAFDYLIITQDSLYDTFVRLRDWKTMKGVKTRIVTVDSIQSLYPSGSLNASAVDIKRFIKMCCDTYGISKVLLGGTPDVVPSQRCQIAYYKKSYIPYVTDTPSDYFYSCLGGTLDWDANHNGIVGEPENDGVVLTPTVSVTRLPIKTKTQLSDYITKLLKYEQNPPRLSYATQLLLSGDSLHWVSSGLSDAHIESEMLYRSSFPDYYADITKSNFYDSGNNIGRYGQDSLMNASNLSEVIESCNPHYFNMDCHGDTNKWKFELSDFTCADVLSLENEGYPMVVTTSACCTADFTYPCLGEAFLCHPAGGAIAYWGSSNYGIGNDTLSYNLSPSMQMCSDFWRLLPNSCHFGDAVVAAKKDNLLLAGTYQRPYNWLLKSMNALGDCEMPIYTSNPRDFSSASIYIDYNQVVVESCDTLCAIVSSKGDNGLSFFMKDDSICYTSADIHAKSCNVCLTKQNYVPFVIETGRFIGGNENYLLLLQNQQFLRNRVEYYATNIHIGENVDSSVEAGEVIVEKDAVLTMVAEGRVEIESGFKCELGGTFLIH